MNYRRKGKSAVVWRKTPKELTCMSVYGKNTIITKSCDCCKEIKLLSEYYMDSKKPGKVRDCCVVCYDLNDGGRYMKFKRNYRRQPGAPLYTEEQSEQSELNFFLKHDKP